MSEDGRRIKTHHGKCWTYHRKCLEGKLLRFLKEDETIHVDRTRELLIEALAKEIDEALLSRDKRIAELERRIAVALESKMQNKARWALEGKVKNRD